MLRRALFHNFQLVYRLDRWFRRRFTSLGALFAGALVIGGIFGIDTRRTVAYQFVSLIFALLLLAIISAVFFRVQVRARRRLPRYATVGEPFSYTVEVENSARREGNVQRGLLLSEVLQARVPKFHEFRTSREPGAGRRNWFDRRVGYPRWSWLMQRSRGALTREVALPDLPAGVPVRVDLPMTPLRRGYVRFTGLSLARPDPFGLFMARAGLPGRENLLVLPKRYPMPHLELPGSRHYQRGGVALATSTGDSQEFASLREYRPGDPLRHIHWKSWARFGEPIVKEFQDEYYVRQALILDTFMKTGGNERFEEAVSVAASLVCETSSRESLLDLVFVGTESYYFTSGRGVGCTEHLLEMLACVDVCTTHEVETLRHTVLEHAGRLSGCVLVLLSWDAERRQFVEALRRTGLPVLVYVMVDRGAATGLDPGPMADRPAFFRVLEAGQVAEGLADARA